MRKLRVLALMHEDLVPPDDLAQVDTKQAELVHAEYDVCSTLRALGHEVHKLGIWGELAPIKKAIDELKPHIAFNLVEEFRGETVLDYHIVSHLELLRLSYTGCNPRGLMIARDKALSKQILHYHRIRVPDFAVFPIGRTARRPKRLRFPLIVKSLVEEASLGIAQASVVEDDDKLRERVRFIHERIGTDAIVEQYIDGRELYAGVLGNDKLQVFPTWELVFADLPTDAAPIATAKVKWDKSYQMRHGINSRAAELSAELEARIAKMSRRVFRRLSLSGYARLDYRLRADGELFLLEANPNPHPGRGEDFAAAAQAAGLPYEQLLQKILSLGLRRNR